MTEAKTKKVQLARAAKIEGDHYAAGATFEGDAKLVADLIASGVANDPKAKAEDVVDTEVADERAKEIVAEAEAEAKTLLDAANTTAEGIVAEANAKAEQILAAAKAEADQVAEEAKAAAAASKAAETNQKATTDSKSK